MNCIFRSTFTAAIFLTCIHLSAIPDKELIVNGNLEKTNDIRITEGTNQTSAIRISDRDVLNGKRSLVINTLAQPINDHSAIFDFQASPGVLYKINYKVRYVSGDGFVSVNIADRRNPRQFELYHTIGNSTAKHAVNQPDKVVDFQTYSFFNASELQLIIRPHGQVKVVLDDISIQPIADTGKMWQKIDQQRMREFPRRSQLQTQLITPHINWGKPGAYPRINLLTLMPAWSQRQTLELAERFDVNWRAHLFRSAQTVGFDFWQGEPGQEPQLYRPVAELRRQLDLPTDCIYISGIKFQALNDVAPLILEKIKAGTGLVIEIETQKVWKILISPDYHVPMPEQPWMKKDGQEQIDRWKIAINNDTQIIATPSVMNQGSIFMPPTRYYQYGKGRIVMLSAPTVYFQDNKRKDFEAQMAYTMKAIQWASNRLPDTFINKIKIPICQLNDTLRGKISRSAFPVTGQVVLNQPAPTRQELCWWVEDAQCNPPERPNRVIIPAGQQAVQFQLSSLPTGRQWIDYQLKDERGILDWKTVDLTVDSPLDIKGIELSKPSGPYLQAGQTIQGNVILSQPVRDTGYKLTIKLFDGDHHQWGSIEKNSPLPKIIPFTFHHSQPVVLYHRIAATLANSEPVAQTENEFCIVRSSEWDQNTFQFQQWQFPTYNYLGELMAAEMRKHGITSVFYTVPSRQLAVNNIRAIPALVNFLEKVTCADKNTDHPRRDPCLTSSSYRQQSENNIITMVGGSQSKWAPLAYALAHEVNLKGFGAQTGNCDICFSPSCLIDFQNFLKQEYGTLDQLNRQWLTGYRDWNEITPLTLQEAIGKGQIQRWIDHRRHMDYVWTRSLRSKVEIASRFIPGSIGLVDNVLTPDSYSGVDFWQLLHVCRIAGSGLPPSYQLAFVPPENRYLSVMRTSAWHMDQVTENRALFHTRFGKGPWMALLSGYHGCSYWTQIFDAPPGENFEQPLMPDLSTTDFVATINPAVARIRSGLDRLVFNSRIDGDRIAILYSRSSEHAETAWKQMVGAVRFKTPFVELLLQLNYQVESISEEQIAKGELSLQSYRLLILPFTQAMKAETARRIAQFVSNGGSLWADVSPAIADEHGILSTSGGALDPVFGIRQNCRWTDFAGKPNAQPLQLTWNGVKTDLPAGAVIPGPALASVHTSAATSFMKVNHFGQGQALLMNFAVKQSTPSILNLTTQIMQHFNLKPPFAVTFQSPLFTTAIANDKETPDDQLADNEGYMNGGSSSGTALPILARRSNGNIHIFGIWFDQHLGHGQYKSHLTFPTTGHIYDLKTSRYLGKTNVLDVTIEREGLLAYAQVPFRIPAPQLTCRAATVDGMNVLHCEAIITAMELRQEPLVAKFGLIAPDGREWNDFAVTAVMIDGRAHHTFYLPQNAPVGNWTCYVQEAISGLRADALLTLTAPAGTAKGQ